MNTKDVAAAFSVGVVVAVAVSEPDNLFTEDDYQSTIGDTDLHEDAVPDMKPSKLNKERKKQQLRQSINAKIIFFTELNKSEPALGKEEMIIDTSAM